MEVDPDTQEILRDEFGNGLGGFLLPKDTATLKKEAAQSDIGH